jgi:hypothetical protein
MEGGEICRNSIVGASSNKAWSESCSSFAYTPRAVQIICIITGIVAIDDLLRGAFALVYLKNKL